jgi:hypothetical protein
VQQHVWIERVNQFCNAIVFSGVNAMKLGARQMTSRRVYVETHNVASPFGAFHHGRNK